jgi:hypothetical protein
MTQSDDAPIKNIDSEQSDNDGWTDVLPEDEGVVGIYKIQESDTIVGEYLGTDSVKNANGPPILYHVIQEEGPDGEKIGVWGVSDLNAKLAKVRSGTKIRLRYIGEDLDVPAGYSPKALVMVQTKGTQNVRARVNQTRGRRN